MSKRRHGGSSSGLKLGPAFRVSFGSSRHNQGMEYFYAFVIWMVLMFIAGIISENRVPQLNLVENTLVSYVNCNVSQTESGSIGNGNVSIEKVGVVPTPEGVSHGFIVRANGFKPFRLQVFFNNNVPSGTGDIIITATTDNENGKTLYRESLKSGGWNFKLITIKTTSGESLYLNLSRDSLTYSVVIDPAASCSK
jgi:hypothetical protein